MGDQYLKCSFCNWKTPAWTTRKNGKRVYGFSRLQSHVMMDHIDEYAELKEKQDNIEAILEYWTAP